MATARTTLALHVPSQSVGQPYNVNPQGDHSKFGAIKFRSCGERKHDVNLIAIVPVESPE